MRRLTSILRATLMVPILMVVALFSSQAAAELTARSGDAAAAPLSPSNDVMRVSQAFTLDHDTGIGFWRVFTGQAPTDASPLSFHVYREAADGGLTTLESRMICASWCATPDMIYDSASGEVRIDAGVMLSASQTGTRYWLSTMGWDAEQPYYSTEFGGSVDLTNAQGVHWSQQRMDQVVNGAYWPTLYGGLSSTAYTAGVLYAAGFQAVASAASVSEPTAMAAVGLGLLTLAGRRERM